MTNEQLAADKERTETLLEYGLLSLDGDIGIENDELKVIVPLISKASDKIAKGIKLAMVAKMSA